MDRSRRNGHGGNAFAYLYYSSVKDSFGGGTIKVRINQLYVNRCYKRIARARRTVN